MRKLLFGMAALLLMANCSRNGVAEKAKEDSIRTADSLAQVESAKAEAAREQARLDSLRTDSIKKAEAEAFYKKLPDPKKLLNGGNPTKYLKSLGFKGSYKTVPTMEGDKCSGKYSLETGDKSIIVQWESLLGSDSWEVTIKNDNKALEDYYSKAKKQQGRGEYWDITVKKNGNTVKMYSNSD